MINKTASYLTGRFFDGISSGLFLMALPWIMLKEPNMGTFVALVAVACTAVSFIATPFFATLIDRHSRKTLLIVNQMIQATMAAIVLGFYFYGFASHWLLAGAQLVYWVSSNLAWATNNAFTQENYDKQEYASISGKQEIVLQGTTLSAGALGVFLLEHWSMIEFAGFAAVASTIATFAYLVTPYRQKLRSTQKTGSGFISQILETKSIYQAQPIFFSILLLSCLSYPVLTYISKLVPIWFSEINISGNWFAGYYMTFAVGSMLTGLFIKRLLGITSFKSTMLYSLAAVGVMLIGMSLFIQPAFLLLFAIGFGFFNALNRIARTNWMHHQIDINQRGRADGILALFSTLVQNLSYLLIAFLSHNGLTHHGFIIAAIVILGAALCMYLLSKKDLNQTFEISTDAAV